MKTRCKNESKIDPKMIENLIACEKGRMHPTYKIKIVVSKQLYQKPHFYLCLNKTQNKFLLVHQLPFTHELHRTSGLGNVMEHIYFGSQHGRVQICAHLMGQVCITGMSNLIRKEALEKACGGLVGLSNYIAEDYFMTKKMESAGYQFQLSRFPALQNQGDVTIKSFFQRMSRWTRLRITMIPGKIC